MAAQVITAVIGIWLMSAPSILNYSNPAATNDHILGPVISTFAVISWWEVTRNLRKVNIVLALWLLLAPWMLNYNDNSAIFNNLAAGVLVGSLSFLKGKIKHTFGGGWAGLFK